MATIEELHRSIKYLIGRDKTVDTWIQQLRTVILDTDFHVDNLKHKVKDLTTRDATFAAQIRELYGDGANSRRMATNLTDDVSVLTGRVDGISVSDTNKAIEHLTDRFNQLTAVNRPLKGRIDIHSLDIVRLINKVSAAEDRADVAMDHVEMLENKVEKLERTVEVQQENIHLFTQLAVYDRYAKQDADSVTNDLQDRIMELERKTA